MQLFAVTLNICCEESNLIFFSLEEGSKKICKDSKKIVTALNAQSSSCGKIGSDLINNLGDNASNNLKAFELAMNKQAMLAADKVIPIPVCLS